MTARPERVTARPERATRSPSRSAVLIPCLLAAAALPGIAADDTTGGEAFVFDVTLAPVCLDGTFPLTLATADGPVDAAVTLEPAITGKLTGSLQLGDASYPVKGKVRFGSGGHSIRLTAKAGKKGRLTLSGPWQSGAFEGDARAKGSAFPDATAFTLDASGAEPLVASIAAFVQTKKKGKLGGAATLTVCGTERPLKVRGRKKGDISLKLKTKGFRFIGAGDHVPGNAALTWGAKGFGAVVDSDVIAIDTTLPPRDLGYPQPIALYETEEPILPNVPTVTGDPADAFELTGELPPGLAFDPQTGAISGTPTAEWPGATLTVTATNLAGSVTTELEVAVRRNRMYSLAVQQDLAPADIRHFLTRTQWGVEPDVVVDIQSRGLAKFVDEMLVLPSGTSWELAAEEDELTDQSDPQALVPNSTEVARWWQALMLTSEHPFQEVLAFFWSDLFAVGNQDINRGAFMVDYVNLYRHDGAGNLRDLLLDMARHPAMLRYLNGDQNRRQAPNENFAREFWELFTLGADNGYTQDDIVEASRAFTGWRQRSRVVNNYPAAGRSVTTYYMEFDDTRHDTGDKTFLGVTIPGQDRSDDFASVVDVTLAERDPERFFARKLLEHFVMEEPPEELVDDMGALLRNEGWELAPVLRTIFLSEAFFSSRARGTFVKSPVEFGVGFIRTTGLRIRTTSLDASLRTLGMRPTQPPVVDGWPTGETWLSAQSMVDRTNLARTVVDDVNRQNGWGIDVLDLLPQEGVPAATTVVDELAARLQISLSAEERQELADYLVTVRTSGGDIEPSPLTEGNLDQRVRGLLYALAQHPTYHVR